MNRQNYEWGNLVEDAIRSKPVRQWMEKQSQIVDCIKHVLNQAKIPSMHASAVVIVPKEDRDGKPMDIYDWMPVRKIYDKATKKHVLISEWEGKYIDEAGFLKEDILSLTQLDKFKLVLKLIKENRGVDIVLEDIPLDDDDVFNLFQMGFNEGVFQFNTAGLKRYSRLVGPDSIEDLISMNALYRPGPKSSNAHIDYAEIKQGKQDPTFDYGLKEVTEKTHGLYVFQEQIMKSVHVLGGLSLSEADEVRTIMKKFDKRKMATFKNQFIKGAMSRGCGKQESYDIWYKLEKFSGYGFNRSHSAAYSVMGYWCQWLKYYFEEEFYTAVLSFGHVGVDLISMLNEIEKRGLKTKVMSPDINKSNVFFVPDVKNHVIYWSLTKIKGIGSAISKAVLKERMNGEYKSLDDFLIRLNGSGVGRGAAELLIQAGAFDQLEMIEYPRERKSLIKHLYTLTKMKDSEFHDRYNFKELSRNYGWTMKQRIITGFGEINYKELIKKTSGNMSKFYLTPAEFLESDQEWKKVVIAGSINTLKVRTTKKGKMGSITMSCNNDLIFVSIWADKWMMLEGTFRELKKENALFAISGKIKYNDYSDGNEFYSYNNTNIVRL